MSHTNKRKKAKARILLIEGSRSQTAEIRKHLDLLGYETLWARDGVNGLRLVNAESPDIVILDVATRSAVGSRCKGGPCPSSC
jgi:DNA-binding response OmpR family regulator